MRLLRGSLTADLSADLFNAVVEKISARPACMVWWAGIRIGAPVDDQSMAQLNSLLMLPAGAMPPKHIEMHGAGGIQTLPVTALEVACRLWPRWVSFVACAASHQVWWPGEPQRGGRCRLAHACCGRVGIPAGHEHCVPSLRLG